MSDVSRSKSAGPPLPSNVANSSTPFVMFPVHRLPPLPPPTVPPSAVVQSSYAHRITLSMPTGSMTVETNDATQIQNAVRQIANHEQTQSFYQQMFQQMSNLAMNSQMGIPIHYFANPQQVVSNSPGPQATLQMSPEPTRDAATASDDQLGRDPQPNAATTTGPDVLNNQTNSIYDDTEHEWDQEIFITKYSREIDHATLQTQMVVEIGRESTEPFRVVEYLHPQWLEKGQKAYVGSTLAKFRSSQISDVSDLGTNRMEINWMSVYDSAVRLQQEFISQEGRIQNAFELGMLIEDPKHGTWKPNPKFFEPPLYLTLDQCRVQSLPVYQYYLDRLHRQHLAIFQSEHRVLLEETLKTMLEAIAKHQNNLELIEDIQLVKHVDETPLALYVSLKAVHLRTNPSIRFDNRFYFGHNAAGLVVASAVHEGIIRPSVVDPEDAEWLLPNTFYCRAMIPSHRPQSDGKWHLSDLRYILLRTGKFGGVGTPKPFAIIGEAYSRSEHVKTPSGGVAADHMIGLFFDAVHGADSRWAFRSHLSVIKGIASIFHLTRSKTSTTSTESKGSCANTSSAKKLRTK